MYYFTTDDDNNTYCKLKNSYLKVRDTANQAIMEKKIKEDFINTKEDRKREEKE